MRTDKIISATDATVARQLKTCSREDNDDAAIPIDHVPAWRQASCTPQTGWEQDGTDYPLIDYAMHLAAAPLLAQAGDQASSRDPQRICAEHVQAAKTLKFTISKGCVSSNYRFRDHDFKAQTQFTPAKINITGKFNYDTPGSRLVKRDCGGKRSVDVILPTVEERRYSICLAGRRAGTFDFTKSTGRICRSAIVKSAHNAAAIPSHILRNYKPAVLTNTERAKPARRLFSSRSSPRNTWPSWTPVRERKYPLSMPGS